MSIVLVCFSNAPKVSDEAVRKDSELDKHLESRVEGKESLFSFFPVHEGKKKNILPYQMILLKCSQWKQLYENRASNNKCPSA